jgi:vacuolar protein sorting-associated protein 35
MTKNILEDAMKENKSIVELGGTKKIVTNILLAPVNAYSKDILMLLNFPSGSTSPILEGHSKSVNVGGHFTDILFLLSFGVRRTIGNAVAKNLIKANLDHNYAISTIDGIHFILGEVCSTIVRDQIDGTLFGTKRVYAVNEFKDEQEGPLDWEDAIEEQTMMAQLVHIFKSNGDDLELDFSVCDLNLANA